MPALIQFASGAPGIKYQLDKRYLFIGRGSTDNDVVLPCAFVSKRHAVIELVESGDAEIGAEIFLEDLGSTNHTYVNGQPIDRVRLQNGDVIRIGKNTLKFDASGELPELNAVKLDVESAAKVDCEARTWNFSRRLRLISSDAEA